MDQLNTLIKHESFRFFPTTCNAEGISLQAAKFLRWLFIEPGRSNAQIIPTFGMGLAWTMLNAGYVSNPLGEEGISHTNLWSLTDNGMKLLLRLVGDGK